jgi:predicted O-linked N-acetylglucosamine transferase (SPINDLY family)
MATLSEALAIALRHYQAGRLAAAEQLCRQILGVDPDRPDALNLLGLVAYRSGRYGVAVDYIGRALALRPQAAGYHLNLGAAHAALQQFDEAAACYRQALEIQPNLAEAHGNLGDLCEARGQTGQAIACYRRALELQPADALAGHRLGLILQRQGELDEAAACYRGAIAARPDFAEAHNDLANALRERGRLDEAAACCRRAIALRPELAAAHHNLGNTWHDQGKLEQAIACYREAIRLCPDFAATHVNLGNALLQQGKTEEAIACYAEAATIEPSAAARYHQATSLPVVYQSVEQLHAVRWRLVENLDALLEAGVCFDPRRDVVNGVFYLAYQGLNDREIQERIARLWCPDPPEFDRGPRCPGDGRGPIRIGFVSRFFKAHTVGEIWRGIIAQLSREKFAVSVFALGHAADATADFIRRHADRYCELPLDLAAARRGIAAAELDVLFYTDVGMDPLTGSLAHGRLAPVQCATWGHPVTTGLPTMDYYVSSELLDSDDAPRHYTEQLVRLKSLGLYVYRPEAPPPRKSRADFGLPEDRHLYGCLQSLFKFHPDYDAMLAAILRRDPQGLLLVPEGTCSHWKDLLLERFCRVMPDVVPRIHWLPWQEHADYLRLHAVLDVLLVPPYFGGGKSSYDALALGVPVVTLPSPLLRGRITYGMYRAMQVMDCVAGTPDEYVEIALRLATDAGYREAIGAKIRAAAGRLFEDLDAVRELERFLQWAVTHDRNEKWEPLFEK